MHLLQDAINARVYQRDGIDRQYQDTHLGLAEGVALLKYQPAFAGKDVLDIGVGTGRTTLYLAPLARRYQAIDYSPVMVRQFEHELPGIPIALTDMREMSQFPDTDFDFVLASNNVFDAIGHEDRLHTLREIHRVLRDDGTLIFSSHNQGAGDLVHMPRLTFSRNPFTQVKLTVHWCLSLINHAHLQGMQTFASDHAIINDESHDSALLHYYIAPEAQRRQLAEQGFELLDIFDDMGVPVSAGSRAENSHWLLYVARRLPVS